MPKILSRQPAWLERGQNGFDLFLSTGDKPAKAASPALHDGPLKRVAHRGTEVFVAVDQELRWSDLAVLKDQAHEGSKKARGYKVLKVPVSRPIRQLSISPSGDLIAVLTTHTCHVCLIPPSGHLNFPDAKPLAMRYFQVGPTAHVLEQSPLVSAIWHPLSPSGNGLVTITKDACVRLWELDSRNRSTFDEPALAVDLKKLGNAATAREDFSASKYGTNKGFTPDEVEMQVAAGCFGGSGRDDEDGWSSMTLWVAMTEGDVYALCPFLPSRFGAPPTLLPTLSTSVVAKSRIFGHDQHVSDAERRVAEQQSHWLAHLDSQDPVSIPGALSAMDVYSRPDKPGAIAKLQGPFRLTPEPDFGEITDIHVMAPKVDDRALFDEEDWHEYSTDEGSSIGIVCLASNTGQVHVCLNGEGVEAEWLPSKRSRAHLLDDDAEEQELILLESIELRHKGKASPGACWPTFTPSPADRYELFTAQAAGIYSISLRPWVRPLEDELSAQQPDSQGVGLRTGVIYESAKSSVELITAELARPKNEVNAAIAILDPVKSDIGYLVLTSTSTELLGAVLDVPVPPAHSFEPDAVAANLLPQPDPRAPYQPPQAFFEQSALPAQIHAWRQENTTATEGDIRDRLKMDSSTLQKMTEAHRILSSETHGLKTAAADLFRRCERMLSEMKGQVERVRELSDRIDSVTGADPFPDQKAGQPVRARGGQHLQTRIQASKEKTREIKERVEALRRKTRGLGGTELSARERAFAAEISQLDKSLADAQASDAQRTALEDSDLTVSTDSDRSARASASDQDSIAARFDTVRQFYEQIRAQAEEACKELEESSRSGTEQTPSASSTAGGLSDYRKLKLAQTMELLDRQTALVEAVNERFERLKMGGR